MTQQNYELAERDYMNGTKYKDIAEKYGVTINTVKSWKQRYSWSKKGVHTKEKVCTQKKDAGSSRKMPEVDKSLTEPLNDNQRLFCEIYANNRNATIAYIQAYGVAYETARTAGPRLLQDVRLRAYVEELLRIKRESIFFSKDDLIEKQMRIAFANMSDFVDFGKMAVPAMVKLDPRTGEQEVIYKQTNGILFKESLEVDGSLICEISTTKNGAKLKLEDRQKAMDWLANYFMLNPNDKHKQEYDRKRYEQDERKLALDEREVKLKEDKEHGVTKDIEAIREGLKDIFSAIGSPVPNRVIDDE